MIETGYQIVIRYGGHIVKHSTEFMGQNAWRQVHAAPNNNQKRGSLSSVKFGHKKLKRSA